MNGGCVIWQRVRLSREQARIHGAAPGAARGPRAVDIVRAVDSHVQAVFREQLCDMFPA